MKRFVALAIYAIACSSAFAKSAPKIRVTVIENVPTTYSYDWQVAGKATVSCDSSSCSSYYMPPSSGTQSVRGAVLKLLLPDGRIVIAECVAKENVALSLIRGMATSDPDAPLVLRDCRIPAANSTIDAEFNRSEVKLFLQAPSIDGTGRTTSETYLIKGVLQPTAPLPSPLETATANRIAVEKKAASALEEGDQLFKGKQFSEAFSKYLDASVSGDTQVKGQAEQRIGMMYLQGNGVTENRTTSRKWLGEAALLGNQDAKDALAKLNASAQMLSKIAADPELKAKFEANVNASRTSPAAAASLLYENSSGWNSKTPEERAQMLKDGQASRFMILTTPAGAEIDIDGNRLGVSPLGGTLLRYGDQYRTITVKMAGYVTVEKKFLPDGKDIPLGITLEPESSASVRP
jgi:PEGA domain